MPYNVTIDDLSPLITYTGKWRDSYMTPDDPYMSRYSGYSFHASLTNDSQASVTFNGTAIYIFGAKRGNHGPYVVTIDGGLAERFDGYAPTQPDGADGVYQVPIFVKTGLSSGKHNVVLNNGADSSRPWVDIDFITWTSDDPTPNSNITVDDGGFTYTSPGADWLTTSRYVGDYLGQTQHVTNVGGATASITFEGSGFYLYGGTLNDHGLYNVQVDNHDPVRLNGSTKDYHPQKLLYYADGLGYGLHKLIVTNAQDGAYLDIDFIVIMQPSPQSNPNGKALTSITAGIVCVFIGLAWLTTAIWWLVRQRKRRQEGADLLNQESKPYIAPATNEPVSGGPGWSDTATPMNSMGRDQSWVNDPAHTGYTGLQQQQPSDVTHSQSGPNLTSICPPSSVSGSQGPGSSLGGGSTHGGEAPTTYTRPSAQHQPLSQAFEPESDPGVNEMVPPPSRPATVPSAGTRGDMTEDKLRESRMRVPERLQDWGPALEGSENEYSKLLPPDDHQAIEPFHLRPSGGT